MSRRTGSKLPSAMDYTKAFRRKHTAKPFSCGVSFGECANGKYGLFYVLPAEML